MWFIYQRKLTKDATEILLFVKRIVNYVLRNVASAQCRSVKSAHIHFCSPVAKLFCNCCYCLSFFFPHTRQHRPP